MMMPVTAILLLATYLQYTIGLARLERKKRIYTLYEVKKIYSMYEGQKRRKEYAVCMKCKRAITQIVDDDLNKLNDDGRAVQRALSPQYLYTLCKYLVFVDSTNTSTNIETSRDIKPKINPRGLVIFFFHQQGRLQRPD